jgi:hypothetical protein
MWWLWNDEKREKVHQKTRSINQSNRISYKKKSAKTEMLVTKKNSRRKINKSNGEKSSLESLLLPQHFIERLFLATEAFRSTS